MELPEYVSVQVNSEMLLRANFAAAIIKKDAQVEFFYYIGGGSDD
ncbi:ubiquitin family protein [Breznakiellaceae bacterium SP9]